MSAAFSSELKIAFRIVWIILSIFIFAILILSFFFPYTFMDISPVCVSKSVYGAECFMCGMTRAFIEISSGRFSEAFNLNKLSLILFSVFFINSVIFISYIIKTISVRVSNLS